MLTVTDMNLPTIAQIREAKAWKLDLVPFCRLRVVLLVLLLARH